MATPSEDVQVIIMLLKRERFYRDTAQWQKCRDAFHPDSSLTYVNVAWYEGQIEDFVQKSAQMHRGKVNIIHAGFDPVDISVRDDRAISQAFCSVTSAVTLGGIDYELCSHMRLFTRLKRFDGAWRMLTLESTYVRDRLVRAFPGPVPDQVQIPDGIETYPKPYRSLALVMSSRGLKPRPSLPHEDDPESVQRIDERNRAFLYGR